MVGIFNIYATNFPVSPKLNSVWVCTISIRCFLASFKALENPFMAILRSLNEKNGILFSRTIPSSLSGALGSVVVKIITSCPCASSSSFRTLMEVDTPLICGKYESVNIPTRMFSPSITPVSFFIN